MKLTKVEGTVAALVIVLFIVLCTTIPNMIDDLAKIDVHNIIVDVGKEVKLIGEEIMEDENGQD